MSGASNRRRRGDHAQEEHADERWLLTYSDMITLLMALFIVMWSISSVNISKFDQLKASLKSAFSGKVLPADTSIMSGQTSPFDQDGSPIQPLVPSLRPAQSSQSSQSAQSATRKSAFRMDSIRSDLSQAAAQKDLENLERIERQVQRYAVRHGFASEIKTTIDERGLVVRLLTDEVLFDSGQAVLKSQSQPLLSEIAALLSGGGIVNPVRVEGNTDNVPISSSEFRSNWELSTARATAVLEFLLAHGVAASRLSATGYADQHPVASNATAQGRSLNRRVEIVVLRRSSSSVGGQGS